VKLVPTVAAEMEDLNNYCGLSLIIPYRNRKHCVNRCLRPLLEQKTSFPFEIIISDHGSTDGSIEYIIRKYKEYIGTGKIVICLYPLGEELGFNLARSRNIGALYANYDILFTFDIDTICLKNSLLQRLHSSWFRFDWMVRLHGVPILKPLAPKHLTKAEKVNYDNLRYRPNGVVIKTVGWGNSLFHRNLVFQIGGWAQETFTGKGYEDLAFFLLAFRQGYYPVQDILTNNRKNNDWLHNKKDKDLPPHKKVEIFDKWEGGCGPDDKKNSYRKFRILVHTEPMIMHNNTDWTKLVQETETIGNVRQLERNSF